MNRGYAAPLLASALLAGCSAERSVADPTATEARATLHRVFAAHAAAITAGPAALALAPSAAGFEPSRASARLRVALPARGEDAIRLETTTGFAIEVRELDVVGEGTLDGAAVAYPRAGGASWWRLLGGAGYGEPPEGLEEWLLLDSGAPAGGGPVAAWEIAGGSPRQAGAWIEILDGAGVPRLRVAAPIAYAASGHPVGVRLVARGACVEAFLDGLDGAPPGEPLLVDPTWTSTAAMSTAREQHTATLLADGQVLVAGGNGTQSQATAELYDPPTQAFSLTGTMSVARVDHFAALLPSGLALVAGGDGLDTAETYDPVAGIWSITGPLSAVRSRAAGVVLLDGRVLLTGGDGTIGGVDLYDPAARTWTPVSPLLKARTSHSATLLPDGTVLVVGGVITVGTKAESTASTEIYDPTTDTWSYGAALPAARAQHSAVTLADGRVLVAGGLSNPADSSTVLTTAAIYDPVTRTWQAAPSLTAPRVEHTATLLPGGAVLVTGGLDGSSSAQSSAEVLDPAAAAPAWVTVTPMAEDRILHTATALAGGSVLVAGGEQQSSAEIFAPSAPGAPCSVAAQCLSGACSDGVCCATACTAACHSCALPGSVGVCTPAPAGTDPRSNCGDGKPCDLTCGPGGTCESQAGKVCAAGGCSADGTSEFPAATCVAGNPECPLSLSPCTGGYRCDEDAGACRATCGSLADCAPGFACDPTHACVLLGAAADSNAPSCAHAPSLAPGVGLSASGALSIALLLAARARRRRA